MKSLFSKLRAILGWVLAIAPERALFFGGIGLVGFGVGLHDRGAGFGIVGILMLLSLKPFWGWLK